MTGPIWRSHTSIEELFPLIVAGIQPQIHTYEIIINQLISTKKDLETNERGTRRC
jgi:hypothetical protein